MSAPRWIDKHGDVWTLGDDGLLHTPETAPFSREHVEKKWGPLKELTPCGSLACTGCAVCIKAADPAPVLVDGDTREALVEAEPVERCPGCGSVTVQPGEDRAGCHAVSVDRNKPGYGYLKDTWGWCFTKCRDVKLSETPFLAQVEAAAEKRGAEKAEAALGRVRALIAPDAEMACYPFGDGERYFAEQDIRAALDGDRP